jgi:predicted alpha/beta-hydrolase family hydrolase
VGGGRELKVPLNQGETTAIVYDSLRPPTDRRRAFILAHGAGAGQQSAWIVNAARALTALGVQVVTFNFPYTEHGRKLPDRGPILEDCYRAVIAAAHRELHPAALFIGGKSMGGRIATQVAAAHQELDIAGLVLLGYPLHPPGRPQQRRDAHLPAIRQPMLFVQGSRDAFGTRDELAPVIAAIGPHASMHVVEGGDHSFKVAGRDKHAQDAVLNDVWRAVAAWIDDL